MKYVKIAIWSFLVSILGSPYVLAAEKSPVLSAMQLELERTTKGLGEKVYFIGYRATDTQRSSIKASYGALASSSSSKKRFLDVDVRVGDYQLDNTHSAGADSMFRMFGNIATEIPIENDIDAIRAQLWIVTDKRFKKALEDYDKIKSNRSLKVEEEDQSADFSKEKKGNYIGPVVEYSLDQKPWQDSLRKLSKIFMNYPELHTSGLQLDISAINKYLATSEGTLVQQGQQFVRLSMYASTRAEDGMKLRRRKIFDAFSLDKLPPQAEIEKAIKELAQEVIALRNAPVGEPYNGPAILSGEAAGVFFHEIFGHRIEGHRQKDEEDGQTFTKKVNQKILPEFVQVTDDPTLPQAQGQELRGYYKYDDQGVAAQAVEVVKNGVLKNFLMSRSPVAGFPSSNGHGRAEQGFMPVARQGNLIIKSSKPLPKSKLRQILIAECKKKNKPYGLFFDKVTGGFTFTGRGFPQAFDIFPVMVYRVYVDGRPDELIRGVELIGTPLTSFSQILAMSDDIGIFNGTCGAESGAVPVSSVAPTLLTAQIEVQKKEKSSKRPPLLPPPGKEVK
jgi:predicted Zn-dependent protease